MNIFTKGMTDTDLKDNCRIEISKFPSYSERYFYKNFLVVVVELKTESNNINWNFTLPEIIL